MALLGFPVQTGGNLEAQIFSLNATDYLLSFWYKTGTEQVSWNSGEPIEFVAVNYATSVTPAATVYHALESPNLVYYLKRTNPLAGIDTFNDYKEFSNLILSSEITFKFGSTANDDLYVWYRVRVRNVISTLPETGSYYRHCGILDWLRGECIHGIV